MSETAVRQRIHKKSLIVLLIITFLILGAASLIFVVWSNSFAVITKPQSALVSVLSGAPEVSEDGSNYHEIKDGEFIYSGSTFRTDAETRALLVFSDNSVVTIDYNTQIKLDEINQNRLENTITIQQQVGKIFSQVEKIFGVNENYTVEAKGVIAAVRGTKFGTGILDNGNVRVYVKDSTVQISLTDPNKTQSQEPLLLTTGDQDIIDPDKDLTGDEFNKGKTEYQNDGSDWDKLNDCLSQILDSIQLPDQKKYEYIQEKYKELVDACVPKTPATPTATPPKPAPAPAPPPPPARITSISDNGFYTTNPMIQCYWTDENATTFDVGVGTSPGNTNTVNWFKTPNNNYDGANIGMVYGPQYFCVVSPIGPGPTEGWAITDGIYFDDVTGTLTFTGGSYWGGSTTPLTATATVSNAAAAGDVHAYYYIQQFQYPPAGGGIVLAFAGPPPSCNSNYSNGSAWTASPTWFQFNGPINALTSTLAYPGSGSSFCIFMKLVNDKTGKEYVPTFLGGIYYGGYRYYGAPL